MSDMSSVFARASDSKLAQLHVAFSSMVIDAHCLLPFPGRPHAAIYTCNKYK